jgi:hypothetical protein
MNEGLKRRGKTSQSDEWETPPWLFKALDSEFGFTFDAAGRIEPVTIERGADKPPLVLANKNPLCKRFSTDITQSVISGALTVEDRVFCNPPYSEIELFIRHALETPNLWVLVLPAFMDKLWYRMIVESEMFEQRPFIERVKFYLGGIEPEGSPFFGTFIAIKRPM